MDSIACEDGGQCGFGKRVAISEFVRRANMFKITTVDTQSQRRLVVEGTLIGPWVAELRATWKNALQELGDRKMVIDLGNLTVISIEGEDAIFELMKDGARFSRGGVLTRHVVRQLTQKKQRESSRR
jgi:hypothetical protein